jgi:hypothetical protein
MAHFLHRDAIVSVGKQKLDLKQLCGPHCGKVEDAMVAVRAWTLLRNGKSGKNHNCGTDRGTALALSLIAPAECSSYMKRVEASPMHSAPLKYHVLVSMRNTCPSPRDNPQESEQHLIGLSCARDWATYPFRYISEQVPFTHATQDALASDLSTLFGFTKMLNNSVEKMDDFLSNHCSFGAKELSAFFAASTQKIDPLPRIGFFSATLIVIRVKDKLYHCATATEALAVWCLAVLVLFKGVLGGGNSISATLHDILKTR